MHRRVKINDNLALVVQKKSKNNQLRSINENICCLSSILMFKFKLFIEIKRVKNLQEKCVTKLANFIEKSIMCIPPVINHSEPVLLQSLIFFCITLGVGLK
jgi:hypothetical protein